MGWETGRAVGRGPVRPVRGGIVRRSRGFPHLVRRRAEQDFTNPSSRAIMPARPGCKPGKRREFGQT